MKINFRPLFDRLVILSTATFFVVGAVTAQSVNLESGTNLHLGENIARLLPQSNMQIEAQLLQTLDAKKAEVGSDIIFKTTSSLKHDGKVMIEKGARVIGRIVAIQAKSKTNDASMITFVVNRIEHKNGATTINAVIRGLTPPKTFDDFAQLPSENARSGDTGSASQPAVTFHCDCHGSSGGGETEPARNRNTVAASESGESVGVGNAAFRGLRITQPTDSTILGDVTLSMSSRNLRLDSGTIFNFAISEVASITPK